jgi:hypothetical protein
LGDILEPYANHSKYLLCTRHCTGREANPCLHGDHRLVRKTYIKQMVVSVIIIVKGGHVKESWEGLDKMF